MLVGNMQAAQDGYDIEDRLSEALAYYAKADTYAVPHGASDHPPIMADRGKIAHAALSGGGRSLTPIEGTGG